MADDKLAPYRADDLEEALKFSETVRVSKVFPALTSKEQIFAIVATGRELGLPPMQALRSIHFFQGKPTLSSELMLAISKRHPKCEYIRLVESSDQVATFEGKRTGEPTPTKLSYTIKDAQTAGLAGKPTWKCFPKEMLRARCAAALCRLLFGDLLLGVFDSDSRELEDGIQLNPAVADVPVANKIKTQDADFEPIPPATPANDELTMTQKLALSGWKIKFARATTGAELDTLCTESANDAALEGARAHVLAYLADARRKVT